MQSRFDAVEVNRNINRIDIPQLADPLCINVIWCRYNNYSQMPQSSSDIWHRHTFFELHMTKAGDVSYQIGKSQVRVAAGEFLLLAPDTYHRTVAKGDDLEKYGLCFELSEHGHLPWVARLAKALTDTRPQAYPCTAQMNGYIEQIFSEAQRGAFGYPMVLRSLVFLLLMEMVRTADEGLCHEEGWHTQRQDKRMNMIEKYVLDNICQGISVADVAASVQISVKQLGRLLEKEKGMTPKAFMDHVKYVEAAKLLRASNYSVGQVSELLRFGSEFSFIRFFKRIGGISPGQYRAGREGDVHAAF